MSGVLMMSAKEQKRVDVLTVWEKAEATVLQLAQSMEVGERQAYRILQRYRREGIRGVVHRLRAQPSNRAKPKKVREKAEKLFASTYRDYGPTLLAEVLQKNHGVRVDHETLRRWLAGKWVVGRKSRKHRKYRERRSAMGALVQFDGSDHDWFEGRAPVCCLLIAVDDASTRVYARLAPSENTYDVIQTQWRYCERYGIPQSEYVDRHKVYKAPKEGHQSQVARALAALGVTLIYAHSPQAKGRVERIARTLQDRLVKALRQQGISTMAEANRFLENEFLDEYNARFAHPEGLADVHRPLNGLDVKNIFCFQHERVVRNDYTIQFEGRYMQLLNGPHGLPTPRSIVIVRQWLDHTMHIFYRDREIEFKLLKHKPMRQPRIILRPKASHPWRRRRVGRLRTWPWP